VGHHFDFGIVFFAESTTGNLLRPVHVRPNTGRFGISHQAHTEALRNDFVFPANSNSAESHENYTAGANGKIVVIMTKLTVIGGGLAGSEAAWQAAERGLGVDLYEMRPIQGTGAHQTADLAELVCSNSLGSNLTDRASGLLQAEVRRLGSMLLQCADACAVPAGSALAVDRELFARQVTQRIESHPRIQLIREEMSNIPSGLCVVASGPLTSARLADRIADLAGQENLAFYDAIAPIVEHASINMEVAFRASRRDRGEIGQGDYINCPLDREQYYDFVGALLEAERIPLRSLEAEIHDGVRAGPYFEGCLPIEVLAGRGNDALAFGPLRPVGLIDPRTERRPYAVVQLRQDNLAGSLYNMVGFQTNLRHPEQRRVFRMIPGLQQAQFARYGQMHRNTFIASPSLLLPTLQFRNRANLLFAGQIMGVEGYLGNIATGLLAGQNAARLAHGEAPVALPTTTMLGALCHYAAHAHLKDFQPMKANFGILPPVDGGHKGGRRARAQRHVERALAALEGSLAPTRV
jgi:methylenetetrahydrofolate--tRNA-(uracil-5-)-methyltransferase